MLEVADRDRHASDLLTQSVVKIARDACPFGLLRGNQPSRQVPCAAIAGTKGRIVRSSRVLCATAPRSLGQYQGNERHLQHDQHDCGGDQKAMALLMREPRPCDEGESR
jgi:hypothetical protein